MTGLVAETEIVCTPEPEVDPPPSGLYFVIGLLLFALSLLMFTLWLYPDDYSTRAQALPSPDSSTSILPGTETPQPTPTLTPEVRSVDGAGERSDWEGMCRYVVQPGDTIEEIATRFQVSRDDLFADNELLRRGIFRVRQTLIIRVPCCRLNGDQGVTHVVQRRETLYRIANRYGTSVNRIASVNYLYNPNYIQESQMLCIP